MSWVKKTCNLDGIEAPPSTLSYRSHLLLGQKHDGGAEVLSRWDSPPTHAVVEALIAAKPKVFTSFVLVTPCGPLLPGNYE